MPTLEDVVIRSVSSWQKEDCFFCDDRAIDEAHVNLPPFTSVTIRCCARQECQEQAKGLVLLIASDLS